jgi:hypothetical protein
MENVVIEIMYHVLMMMMMMMMMYDFDDNI